MATQMMTLEILPRGKPIQRLPSETAMPRAAPASQVYSALATITGLSVNRIRVTKGSDGQLVPNDKLVPLQQTGLLDGSKIYVKDLGPQISWRTVFIVEYIGPLMIHPLLYQLRPMLYSSPNPSHFPAPSALQKVSLLIICLHYLKREFETIYVHRFSAATMPAKNIFKNSFHYWVLSGLFLGYFIYGPNAPTAGQMEPSSTSLGLLLYGIGELGNLQSHLTLRGLRSEGGKERGIPRGRVFSLVTCPNYMFEILSWIGVAVVTRSLATVVFAAISAAQMGQWAHKKERRYRSEFGENYKNKRYFLFPGIY